jgi:predicted RNA binding protein YcfA (HicA-like mRNA interferase family)
MAKLPSLSGQEVIAAFSKFGFEEVRVHSSHHILKKPGHPFVVSVPVHEGRPVAKGTLRALIRGAGVSVNEFIKSAC